MLAFGPFPEATWFLPAYRLLPKDPRFAFDVVQHVGDVDDDGGPFNRVTFTLTLKEVLSDSVLSSVARRAGGLLHRWSASSGSSAVVAGAREAFSGRAG
ncbi:hypothetical protein AB0A69_33535, partial [Streptomyces sp. NPDC045431]|uniref:hypothetical protein n=1 Tax=Streptomyces sp. NPDC045431 TaxID=3155613 RepID=UPI0033CF7B93